MCEIHHIIPWADGGRTDLNNLTLLCNRHHHIHHANETRRANRACAISGKGKPASDRPPDRGGGAPKNIRQHTASRTARVSAGPR